MQDLFARYNPQAAYYEPRRQRQGDAGYDLCAVEDTILNPGQMRVVPHNVQVNLPVGWFGLIQERSSQGRQGIFTLGNVIDEGYTGAIATQLLNLGKQAVIVHQGDRVSQLVLVPRFIDPDEHTLPTRGDGGFGSTGR